MRFTENFEPPSLICKNNNLAHYEAKSAKLYAKLTTNLTNNYDLIRHA